MQGVVQGGQQPVSGATVQLYAVGTTGDGSAATPLLSPAMRTDLNGGFSITGLTCPSPTTLVYVVATGGNPGLGGTVFNSQLSLMAALGQCDSLTSNTSIVVNELTTVAAVYALAPFMQSQTQVGSAVGDVAGLVNAFTLANELVNPTTGTSPGTNVASGATVPTSQLNLIADIVAACVDTSGGVAGDGSICGTLMSLTNAGTAPTNTIAAVLNMADHPTTNTSGLYALASATGPFQPVPSSVPQGLAVSITYATTIGLSPSSMTFSLIGTPQTAVLTNGSNSTLSIIGITFNGSTNFAETDTCGTSLAPQSACTISVTALPSNAATATMTVTDNAAAGNQTMNVTYTGDLNVTGTDIGSAAVGSSVTGFPTIASTTNVQGDQGTLSGPNAADFSLQSSIPPYYWTKTSTCGGGPKPILCDFVVQFTPSATGVRIAYLTVQGVGVLTLTGTGQ